MVWGKRVPRSELESGMRGIEELGEAGLSGCLQTTLRRMYGEAYLQT
jgi:hypothetical protein